MPNQYNQQSMQGAYHQPLTCNTPPDEWSQHSYPPPLVKGADNERQYI